MLEIQCRRVAWATVLLLSALSAAGQEPVLVQPFEVTPDGMVERPGLPSRSNPGESPPPEVSRSRTLERLHWVCESDLLRSELTLFANGTLRLRHEVEGKKDDRVMWLRELRPEVHDAYVRRLNEPSRAEAPEHTSTVSGEWLPDCTLRLELPGRQPELYSFGSRDVLSHDLERTVGIARELENLFQDDPRPPEGVRQLAYGYTASRGDVLERHDGKLFEVQGFTADGNGVELLGIDDPLTLYLRPEDILQQFRALVPRWFRDR